MVGHIDIDHGREQAPLTTHDVPCIGVHGQAGANGGQRPGPLDGGDGCRSEEIKDLGHIVGQGWDEDKGGIAVAQRLVGGPAGIPDPVAQRRVEFGQEKDGVVSIVGMEEVVGSGQGEEGKEGEGDDQPDVGI